jgi:hypothetical protein
VAIRIFWSDLKVVAVALASVTTIQSQGADFVAATFRNLVEIGGFFDYGKVLVMAALKH